MWRRDDGYESDVPAVEPVVLPELVEQSATRHPNRAAQRYKGGIYDRSLSGVAFDSAPDGEFHQLTYDLLRTIVRRLAVGFRSLGLEPDQRIGLVAPTRMEWAQCDLATLAAGGVVAPVTPATPTDQIRERLAGVDATGAIVANETLLLRLREVVDDVGLRFIVSMDDLPPMYDDRAGIFTLADVYEHGTRYYEEDLYDAWLIDRDAGSLASIVHTAGTTGAPTAVPLTHRNMIENVRQVLRQYGPRREAEGPVLEESTRTVSVLPLANGFERIVGQFVPLSKGSCIGYAESTETLVADCQALEPTMLTGVPALYEQLYEQLRDHATEGAIRRRLYEWAAHVGRQYESHGQPGLGLLARRALAERLVFSHSKAHLGGALELLFSSGGTLSPDLAALYHGMGLPIHECYGLAEATSVVTATPPEEPKSGTIGSPLRDVELRLDPTITPDRQFDDVIGTVGELLLRGPNVATEALGSVTSQEAAVDGSTDWLPTGDIVQRRPDGYVVFHERRSQLFTLSGGPTVAPSPIEDAFATEPFVDQCVAVGPARAHISSLIVPSLRGLQREAESAGVDLPDTLDGLGDHPWVRERIQTAVDRVNDSIADACRIDEFRLLPDRLTVENGLLTPSMEPRRSAVRDRYATLIDSMYDLP
jgi:long-chain acyl-CoA synthetase